MKNDHPIALHEPYLKNTEAEKYALDCINTGWVSSAGKWVSEFEDKLCKYTNSKFAIAVTNGTVGLRLALHVIGVEPSDEVLVPSLTFVATANSVSHLGAIPHFVDIDEKRLSICPTKLKNHLRNISKFENGFFLFLILNSLITFSLIYSILIGLNLCNGLNLPS